MASRDERDLYRDLTGDTDVPASEDSYSLEEILAEYGADRGRRLMEAVEREVLQETEPGETPPKGASGETSAPRPEMANTSSTFSSNPPPPSRTCLR